MLIELDKTGLNLQEQIIMKLGVEEILSQLSEECCELAQAAQKVRRVLHGTTPVSMDDAVNRAGVLRMKNTRWFHRVMNNDERACA